MVHRVILAVQRVILVVILAVQRVILAVHRVILAVHRVVLSVHRVILAVQRVMLMVHRVILAVQRVILVLQLSYFTDKKENEIFLINKEIQSGAVAKSYMRKGFLIYEEMRRNVQKCANISPYMRRPLVISDFATAPF